MSVSVRIDTGNLVKLVSRAIAGQAARKDRADAFNISPASVEKPPSQRSNDTNEA